MNVKTIVIGGIVLVVVLLLVFFLVNKSKTPSTADSQQHVDNVASTGSSSPSFSTGCSPVYTKEQQKRDITAIRGKCNPKLIIPVVGVGYWNKCMSEGKSKLPPICEG